MSAAAEHKKEVTVEVSGFLHVFRKNSEFNKYYSNYYNDILRHAAYLTGNFQAAEDICQETFMKLYGSPPMHENVLAWLRRVASNLSYNYLKGQTLHRKKEEEITGNDEMNSLSIEDSALRNIDMEITRKVLKKLSARDRICLMLKFSGYRYREIAEAIDVDTGSVGTILARAQAKFKEYYQKEAQINEMH